jgi:hypothetical protein
MATTTRRFSPSGRKPIACRTISRILSGNFMLILANFATYGPSAPLVQIHFAGPGIRIFRDCSDLVQLRAPPYQKLGFA